jgi:hypothetical protein
MNDRITSEKYRKLSISALVTGILPYIFTPVIPFVLDPSSKYSVYFNNFATFIMFFYIIITYSLTTAAIVCGGIDLWRVTIRLNNNKGKGLDIAGIILGSIGILYIMFVFILVLVLSSQL